MNAMEATEPAEGEGAAIINASWAGTGAFGALAAAAAAAPDAFAIPLAVLSSVLFLVGTAAFLWSYALAVSRSRRDAIGIGGLYFLSGSAPADVRRTLLLSLGVEVAVAVAAASIRPYTAVAFGILTPVFGLGLCGLWGARYGTFGPRDAARGDVPR